MFHSNPSELLCSVSIGVEDPGENVDLLGSSKGLVDRTRLEKFESFLCCLLAEWPWAHCVTFLYLSVFFCRVRIVILTFQGFSFFVCYFDKIMSVIYLYLSHCYYVESSGFYSVSILVEFGLFLHCL